MIYLDTSVALAKIFAEDVSPPEALWDQPLFSSQLLEYEIWTRLNARGPSEKQIVSAKRIISRVNFVALSQANMRRALEPFAQPVRTLDAVHLAACHFLVEKNVAIYLASYDIRMLTAAKTMAIPIFSLKTK